MTNQGPRQIHVILHSKEIFTGARYAGSEIEARKAASLQAAWRRGSILIIVCQARPPGGRFSIWFSSGLLPQSGFGWNLLLRREPAQPPIGSVE
jgi:hypothetical protein